jgi:5-methylcytosine-specific restriction protein A
MPRASLLPRGRALDDGNGNSQRWKAQGCRVTNDGQMNEWLSFDADPAHVAREREKARALRKSAWWQRRVQRGVCAYCQKPVAPSALTMDHVVPVARGGRSVRGNVVPSCKECNSRKKLLTPAEQLLMKPDGED